MSNYKPLVKTVGAGSVLSATVLDVQLSTTSWGLALLWGTALYSNDPLESVAVLVWESGSPTTGDADHQTFTDSNGIYGITLPAGMGHTLKIYDN